MKISGNNLLFVFIAWIGMLCIPPAPSGAVYTGTVPAVLPQDTLPPAATVLATPQRLAYFPDDAAFYATLDPGAELLARSLILTNRYRNGNVSFSLSYDQENWAGYALGPNYSSLFTLAGQPGCYFKIITKRPQGEQVIKEYYLGRGRCFGIFFNRQENCWDLEENPCKRRQGHGY